MIYFFLRVKLLNFLVYLFFSLKFFNTQNLVKTVAFGVKTQCKVFLIQTCRFGFPEIRLSLASKLAFTHCLKFSSFKDVSSDFEFFFRKIDLTKLLNGTRMKTSMMSFTSELNAVPFSDYSDCCKTKTALHYYSFFVFVLLLFVRVLVLNSSTRIQLEDQ